MLCSLTLQFTRRQVGGRLAASIVEDSFGLTKALVDAIPRKMVGCTILISTNFQTGINSESSRYIIESK